MIYSPPKKIGRFVSHIEHQNLGDIFYLAFLDLHRTSERSYENK